MLAKGFVLSKDALKRARSFDDRHQLLSTASARVASLDRRFGLSDKFSAGDDAHAQVQVEAPPAHAHASREPDGHHKNKAL
uniref:Uncharacterized protein n=1 Tax=Oryza brachyantha TaxID=4533 RepID=J3N8Y1_ORYBR